MSSDADQPSDRDQPPEVAAEWLAGVLPDWVDEGVIEPEQAAAIRRRHGLDSAETARSTTQSRSRLVTAVSAVGAALVGAGLIVFLGTNWSSIPQLVRTLLLVFAPPAAFGVGYQFTTSRDSPRVAHALWTLGAVLTGPSLLLLNRLYELGIEISWLLAGWFVVALAAGESYDSRPTIGLAFGLSVATLVAVVEPTEPLVPIAALGIVLVGLSGLRATSQSTTDDRLAPTYRTAGVSICTLGILWVSTRTHQWYATDLGVAGGLVTLAAIGVIALLGIRSQSRPTVRPLAIWTAAAGLVVALSTAIASAVPELLPDLPALLLIHGLLLGLLLGVVTVGYLSTDSRLITVAVGLIFVQLAVFLASTVGDALPTSIALVVTGGLLLVVAVGLERGRRSLLDRL